jgi:hypothetical protein
MNELKKKLCKIKLQILSVAGRKITQRLKIDSKSSIGRLKGKDKMY